MSETDKPTPTSAVPVGDFEVLVVHIDARTERFGRFEHENEAVDWAMEHCNAIGLPWCAAWYVGRCV